MTQWKCITKKTQKMTDSDIIALIERRRRQILVHSYIYYEMNSNIISDNKWSEWAVELAKLQETYPTLSKQAALSSEFYNFDPSTGMDLPYRQEWIKRKAEQLLQYKM